MTLDVISNFTSLRRHYPGAGYKSIISALASFVPKHLWYLSKRILKP
jgi:hypothetical protein